MKIDQTTTLVTGSSKGIGRATALALAKEGSKVIITYKSDSESAKQTLQECNKFSKGNLIVHVDVSEESSVKKMFEEIKTNHSQLDILVNCVGIFDDNDSPTNIEVFERIYRNNFLSIVTVTKYALEMMKRGKIVNVSSTNGMLGYGAPDSIAYSAFKAALDSYTKNLAKDLAPDSIVNAVAPGRTATAMWNNPSSEKQIELGKVHLTKKMVQPSEIADSIVFLIKNDAICGEILTADGGGSLVGRD